MVSIVLPSFDHSSVMCKGDGKLWLSHVTRGFVDHEIALAG